MWERRKKGEKTSFFRGQIKFLDSYYIGEGLYLWNLAGNVVFVAVA